MCVETDSKVAMTLIQSVKQHWNWKLVILLSMITRLIEKMNASISHIYREGNSAADSLATGALVRRVSQEIRLEICLYL